MKNQHMERRGPHPGVVDAAESREEPMDPASPISDASGDTLWIVSWDSTKRPPVQLSPQLSDAEGSSDGEPEIVKPAEECPFCSSLEYCDFEFDINGDEAYTDECRTVFFHEECSSCSKVDIPLCDFCQHLRLQHLLMCLPPDIPCLWFRIRLPSAMDVWNRKGCGLCRFLSNAISRPLPDPVWAAELSSTPWLLDFNRNDPQANNSTWTLRINFFREYIAIYQKSPRSSCEEYGEAAHNAANECEEFVRWDIVRDWLSVCHENHEECAVKGRPFLPPGFRVIDVHSRRLVQIRDCEFVALSYVWGKRPESPSYVEETTRDNIEALSSTGFGQLPSTIEDAFSVCKNLGKQYLWVDRYCIVQDDNEYKHSQINAMADIYTSSTLTIVDCSGSSVESGLQGVGESRHVKQERISINGLELTHALPNFEPLVVKSIWNTRAWTYQEAVLARRKLFLTRSGAYLECRREHQAEHSVSDDWSEINTTLLSQQDNTTSVLFGDYRRHVLNYTSRNLGYDTDIYNAFEGIARALYGGKCSFYFGIPESQFDEGLLWRCFDDGLLWKCEDFSMPATEQTSHASKNRYIRSCEQTTPSWSWGSVRSWPIASTEERDFSMTLVKWILHKDESSGVRAKTIKATDESDQWLHWQNYRNPDGHRDGICPQLYFALAAREGCIEAKIPCPISTKDSLPSLRRRFTKRWPKYTDAYAELPDPKPKECPQQVDGVLFTRAQSASFRLDSLWIKDAKGRAIGHVYPDPKLDQVVEASAATTMEFIALSLSRYIYDTSELRQNNPHLPQGEARYWTPEYRDMTYFDANDLPLLPIPAVNVMLICWEDGFARRVTVGLVILKHWAKAKREFKDIWLK